MKNIKFALEDMELVLADGIEELLTKHYQEIAHFKDIPLGIDWDKYELAQNAGNLRVFTARVDNLIVGYAVYLIGANPHYKSSIQAVQDVLFLERSCRGALIGSKLITFADKELAAEGVQVSFHHSKVAHPMDSILKRNGYEMVDTLWAKRLDKG